MLQCSPMGRKGKYRKIVHLALPIKTPEEEKLLLAWFEYLHLSGKDRGKATLDLIKKEMESLREQDPALYDTLISLVERFMYLREG